MIDFDNLQDLSDDMLMCEWHKRMSNLYLFLEIKNSGTIEQIRTNSVPAIKVTAELDLLSNEIKRRECDPLDPGKIDAMINLDLN